MCNFYISVCIMEMKIVGIFVGSDVQRAVGEAKSKGTILFTILTRR